MQQIFTFEKLELWNIYMKNPLIVNEVKKVINYFIIELFLSFTVKKEVVSMGTGTKCIGQTAMSPIGECSWSCYWCFWFLCAPSSIQRVYFGSRNKHNFPICQCAVNSEKWFKRPHKWCIYVPYYIFPRR